MSWRRVADFIFRNNLPTTDNRGNGEVEIVHGEIKQIQIEWKIPYSFAVSPVLKHTVFTSPPFSITDFRWQIALFQDWIKESPQFIEICLTECHDVKREYSVECYFGLKKCDGSVEQLVSQILKIGDKETDFTNLIKKSELYRRKSELVSGDVLTIVCSLKFLGKNNNCIQPTALDVVKPLKLIRLNELSENFKDLFANKETCDVTFKVKDNEYKAHRSVLIARSSVFAATFRHNTLERQTGVITILDCDPVSFQQFLDYLYTGKLEELSFLSAQNLYYTSEKYDVEELKEFCVEYLMQCLTVENVCDVAVFSDKYDETQLLKMVQDFFNKNSCKILLTSQWENLLKKDHRLGNKLLREMAKNKT